MKSLFPIPFFLVLALAGCLNPDPGYSMLEDPHPAAFCHIDTCIADPDGPDAKWIHDVYGLEQITHDKHRETIPALEGDWIAWDNPGNSSTGNPVYNMYAFNLATRELISIDVDENIHAFLPRIADGRVLYSHWGPNYTGAVVWDTQTREKTYIHTEGSGKGIGIDKDWIVYSQTEAGSEDGYYAMNMVTEERILLYNSTMHDHNTTYKGLIGADVEDDVATYVIQYADGRGHPSSISVFVLDLNTREKVEYYFKNQGGASRYDQGSGFVVLERNTKIQIMDVETGTLWNSSKPSEECGFPSAEKAWATYRCNIVQDKNHPMHGHSLIRVQNVRSNETIDIWGQAFSLSKAAIDGEGVLIEACRCTIPDWDAPYADLYYASLEDLAQREKSDGWI